MTVKWEWGQKTKHTTDQTDRLKVMYMTYLSEMKDSVGGDLLQSICCSPETVNLLVSVSNKDLTTGLASDKRDDG